MADGFDVAEATRAGIAGRKQAWAFIRAFAAAWATPLRVGDGVDEVELWAVERALGFPLPMALREAYLLFGRRDDLTRNQDRLLRPHALAVDEAAGILVVRDENQSCASWGVRLVDVGYPDPPMFVEHDGRWRPFLDRVSLACVEMVLSEVLLGVEGLSNGAEVSTGEVAAVQASYRRVGLPDYPMWSEPDQPVRWFSAPGQLLRLDGRSDWAWLFVRGRTIDDLRRICRVVPACWVQGNGVLT